MNHFFCKKKKWAKNWMMNTNLDLSKWKKKKHTNVHSLADASANELHQMALKSNHLKIVVCVWEFDEACTLPFMAWTLNFCALDFCDSTFKTHNFIQEYLSMFFSAVEKQRKRLNWWLFLVFICLFIIMIAYYPLLSVASNSYVTFLSFFFSLFLFLSFCTIISPSFLLSLAVMCFC